MTEQTITQKVWLHLLVQGGRWTATELMAVTKQPYRQVDTMLWAMKKRGYVTGARTGERKNGRGYGVDNSCRIPAGLTLAQITASMGVGQADTEASTA